MSSNFLNNNNRITTKSAWVDSRRQESFRRGIAGLLHRAADLAYLLQFQEQTTDHDGTVQKNRQTYFLDRILYRRQVFWIDIFSHWRSQSERTGCSNMTLGQRKNPKTIFYPLRGSSLFVSLQHSEAVLSDRPDLRVGELKRRVPVCARHLPHSLSAMHTAKFDRSAAAVGCSRQLPQL